MIAANIGLLFSLDVFCVRLFYHKSKVANGSQVKEFVGFYQKRTFDTTNAYFKGMLFINLEQSQSGLK